MPDPSGNLMAQSEPRTALFDQRPARVSGLAAVAIICAAAAYSRELGFMVYAVLFAIPHAVFVGTRSSRKWQGWGWAIGWVISAVALLLGAFTALKIMRHSQGLSDRNAGFPSGAFTQSNRAIDFCQARFPRENRVRHPTVPSCPLLRMRITARGCHFAELVCPTCGAPRK
jgi:hypothetical protein